MLRRTLWASIFALLLVSVLSASLAYGLATSTNVATIDWANLEITYEPTILSIDWIAQWNSSYASADSSTLPRVEDREDAPYWGYTDATANVTGSSGQAQGDAYTDDPLIVDPLLYESTFASSDLGGWYEANAWAWRWGAFQVTSGSGYITINVPYTLSVQLNASRLGEYAEGSSSAELGFENWNTTFQDVVSDNINNWITGIDSDSENRSGVLTVSLFFNEWDEGQFGTGVDNYAYVDSPIPEPSTFLLVFAGAGFIGVVFLRKRLRKVS
jgi:hypothetical protein